MAIKALAGPHFSVLSFGIAQIAMDIEPLIGMVSGSTVLHGFTHTYLAALVIALVVSVISPSICRPILRRWNQELSFHRLAWLVTPESFAPTPVIVGAFAGSISHVTLDSIMHYDITPLAPWSTANGMQGLVSTGALHHVCIFAGLFGLLAWVAVGWRKHRVGRDG